MHNDVIAVPHQVSDCKSFFSIFLRVPVGALDMFDVLTYLSETPKVDTISSVSEVYVDYGGC